MGMMRKHEKKFARWIFTMLLVGSLCVTPAVQADASVLQSPVATVMAAQDASAVLASSTKTGWYKKSSSRYEYYNNAGKVTKKLVKKSGFFRYYVKKNGKWVVKKKTWVTVDNNQYYMSSSGRCTTIYYGNTKKVVRYKNGKWTKAKNECVKLADRKQHFFNANGICQSDKGWHKITNTRHVYVNASGTVAYLLKKTLGTWKCYTYKTAGWTKITNKWLSAYGNKFYFNANGTNTRVYYSSSKKCYENKNGKYVLWKNVEKYVGDDLYYFGADGVRVTKSGWYKVSASKEIYVDSKGIVTKSRVPEASLETSAYYTIKLSDGSTTKVYGHFDTDMANEIIKQVNAYRKQNNLEELTVSNDLMNSARTRAYEISYSFSHTRPDGTMCYTASDEMMGENIAAGYRSVSEVMTAWKNSSGHDANMKGSYSTIGVGVFVAESGDNNGYTYYYVQNFGW